MGYRLVRVVVLLVAAASMLGCVKHFRDYSDEPLPKAQVALLQMSGVQLVSIDGAKEEWYQRCGSCEIEELPGAHSLTIEAVVVRGQDGVVRVPILQVGATTQARIEFTAKAGCVYSLKPQRQEAARPMREKTNTGRQVVGGDVAWAPEVVESCTP